MARRFNPAPGWPEPPEGWTPPPGWRPDPAWPPAPAGWKLWIDDRNWFARHKVSTGVGGILAALVVIGALGEPQDSTRPEDAAAVEQDPRPIAPGARLSSTPEAGSSAAERSTATSTTAAKRHRSGSGASEVAAAAAVPAGVPSDAQAAAVERVIDGDTIAVRARAVGDVLESTAQVTLRLLEVDAPETKHPQKGLECFGREAAAFAGELLPVGATVWVAPDRDRVDDYGRDLLYVWTKNGTFVNRRIIAEGYGRAVLYEPNDRFIDQMRAAEATARKAGRGLWTACAEKPAPAEPKQVAPPSEPKPEPKAAAPEPQKPSGDCDPSYPDVCIPPITAGGDLNCGDVPYGNFRVRPPDDHGFDGNGDGRGCESN